MNKLVPYEKCEIQDFDDIYRKINYTGKYKIQTTPYWTDKIFIEHKGFFFKRWIPEENIVFMPEESIEIFECNKL